MSHRVPVYESFTLHHAILRLAGRDFTEDLMKNFTERRHSFSPAAEREIVWDVIVKRYYVGLDIDSDLKSTAGIDKEKTHVFP